MPSKIEEQAKRLRETVEFHFEHWKRDPIGFSQANPEIEIATDVSPRTKAGALRSIADHVMAGTGFDYQVADMFGGDAEFFVGQYDERNVRK